MLTENKFSKYLLYAIGEIILVVIGILIALSINNWNEYQKERIKEEKVLIEVAANVERICNRLTEVKSDLEKYMKSTDTILISIKENLPFRESLNRHFHRARNNAYFILPKSGYEELKNTGFAIVLSDSIKSSIIDLFENTYFEIEKHFDQIRITSPSFGEYIKHNFLTLGGGNLEPVNYSFIMNDHYYKSTLMYANGIRRWQITLINRSLEKSKRVLLELQNEIGESD